MYPKGFHSFRYLVATCCLALCCFSQPQAKTPQPRQKYLSLGKNTSAPGRDTGVIDNQAPVDPVCLKQHLHLLFQGWRERLSQVDKLCVEARVRARVRVRDSNVCVLVMQ